MRSIALIVAMTAVIVSAGLTTAEGKEVSLDRILAEHKITVITAEQPDSISRYLLNLGVRNPPTMTLTELMINSRNLGDGNSLLFIVDRKKSRRLIEEEERLLPCRTSAIGPDEVILFAAKAPGRNAWGILVSAPNEKWLKWELERLGRSNLTSLTLEARGTILERFKVKRLYVVSTEGRQTVADWIAKHNKPGQDAIDWDFCPAEGWDSAADSSSDVMFILNSQALSDKARKSILPYLPKATQDWLVDESTTQESSAARQVITGDEGAGHSVSAVLSPSSRQLGSVLRKYANMEAIPESIERTKLTDLRDYSRVIVVARFADRKQEAGSKVLDDLAGNLTSALSSRTGFQCVNRQDLKELALETYLNQLPDKTPDAENELGDATAVAVVDLSSINAETTYVAGDPRCITPVLPPFDEERPRRPREPDPEDKPLFCAHTYDKIDGSRANDPKFRRDHRQWEYEKMPKYRRELERWEQDKRDYEDRRRWRDMEWVTSINCVQRARITGNLRIYDLRSGEVEQAGRVVFSCPIAGNTESLNLYKEDRTVARGEDSRPRVPEVPRSALDVTDQTVITDAIRAACDEAIEKLLASSLLPIDGAANQNVARK